MAFMGLPCPRNKMGSFMVLSLLFETGEVKCDAGQYKYVLLGDKGWFY